MVTEAKLRELEEDCDCEDPCAACNNWKLVIAEIRRCWAEIEYLKKEWYEAFHGQKAPTKPGPPNVNLGHSKLYPEVARLTEEKIKEWERQEGG